MPEIGTLRQIEQGSVRIISVDSGTERPMEVQFDRIDYPTDRYDGATEVTPSDETQTLATAGKLLMTDITIQPVPRTYGRVAWNGTTLTIT